MRGPRRGWGYMQHLGLLMRGHSKGGLMVVTAAQLDKSGDVAQPLVVEAGYIASDVQWDNLGKEWKQAMKDAEVKDFHMSQFMTGHKRPASEIGRASCR